MKVLVVGGSSGIGAACLEALAKRGCRLATAQRRDPFAGRVDLKLDRAVARVLSKGSLDPGPFYEPLDLRWDYAAIVAAVKRAADALGGLDAVVVSGGVGAFTQARFRSEEEVAVVEEIERTNDLGARAVLRGAFEAMRERRAERLRAVYVGSASARNRTPEIEDYAASKAAGAKWWLEYGRRLAARGVRANVVEAGWTWGPMIEHLKPEYHGKILRSIPLGRYAEPAEVAACVAWLVCEAPDYVASNTLQVTGGV